MKTEPGRIILETQRLLLREFMEDDVEAFFLLDGKDLCAHYLHIVFLDNLFYHTLKLRGRKCGTGAFEVLCVGLLPTLELFILRLQRVAYGGGALQL